MLRAPINDCVKHVHGIGVVLMNIGSLASERLLRHLHCAGTFSMEVFHDCV